MQCDVHIVFILLVTFSELCNSHEQCRFGVVWMYFLRHQASFILPMSYVISLHSQLEFYREKKNFKASAHLKLSFLCDPYQIGF